MFRNFFSVVPYVHDDGAADGACYGCRNEEGNRAVLVDAAGATGVDPSKDISSFRFHVCAKCGSLDLLFQAEDEQTLYEGDYYSFRPGRRPFAERVSKAWRNRYELTGKGIIGKWIASLWPGPQHRSLRPLVNGEFGTPLKKNDRILDFGCGVGNWLAELADDGFTNLTGVDPFLQSDASTASITILKGGLERTEGTFNAITAHHSIEHIEDGETALNQLRSKLSPGGILVARVPLGGSYGWAKYGGNWVQLDPPRHKHLYSVAGFKALASRAGLETLDVRFDSTHFMITGSEARIAGLRPHANVKLPARIIQRVFGRDHGNRIASFTNLLGTADQAAFYLRATQ